MISARLRQRLLRLLFGWALVLAFAGHAGGFWSLPAIERIERWTYDLRVNARLPGSHDERIVIVDIDERSLDEVGRWPWSRDKLSRLLERLFSDYGAALVGFDVVFAEEEGSALAVLEDIAQGALKGNPAFRKTLDALRPGLDHDGLFAQALGAYPVVLGYYFSERADRQRAGALPPPALARADLPGAAQPLVSFRGYGANLARFTEAATGSGHVNPMVDADGVIRRIPMLIDHQGGLYESLSLAVLRALMGGADVEPFFPEAEAPMEALDLVNARERIRIPVDGEGAALVPFLGRQGSFRYVAAADVLAGKAPGEALKGSVVLVGTTAPGLADARATPIGATFPGVEVHANMIAAMLDGRVPEKPAYLRGAEWLAVLLLAGGLAALMPFMSAGRGSLLGLLLLGGFAGFGVYLWDAGMVMPMAATLLALAAILMLNIGWGYFAETSSKRQLARLFGQYVPPELVDEMALRPESYSMEGRNAELTVLFSDVRGFTTLSEGMDPRELAHLMNEYLGAMTEVIRARKGTLDKYIGDAIMAFWGAPLADDDHARHAVEAALAMQAALGRLNEEFSRRGWPALRIGIGLNTGVMTVGDMGSPVRKAYTVLGDAVNLGARLEGITKVYGVGILVSESTVQAVPGFAFRELDRIRVKGKREAVAIYEPLGPAAAIDAAALSELGEWHAALAAYRRQDWDAAAAFFRADRSRPEASELYLGRIESLRHGALPADWDGVTTFDHK